MESNKLPSRITAWQETARTVADALNLLRMHPAIIEKELLRLEQRRQLPPEISFRAVEDDDWLAIRLLVDEAETAELAFQSRASDDRVREAVATIDGAPVGYFGLDVVARSPIETTYGAFIVADDQDHRRAIILAAIGHHLQGWLSELQAGKRPPNTLAA